MKEQNLDIAGLFANAQSLWDLGPLTDDEPPAEEDSEAPTWDGPLFPSLLKLARKQYSGTLQIVLSSGECLEGSLKEGAIQKLQSLSRDHTDVLSDVLREMNVVEDEHLTKATERAKESGNHLAKILLGQKKIDPKQAVIAMRGAKAWLLKEALQSPSGSFLFTPLSANKVAKGPVPAPMEGLLSLSLGQLLRKQEPEALHDFLAQSSHIFPLLEKEDAAWLQRWGWSQEGLSTLTPELEGKTSIKGLQTLGVFEETDRIHCLIAGLAHGRISIAQRGEVEAAVEPEKSALAVKIEAMRRQDFYARLGLHWTCHPKKLQQAYLELLDSFPLPLETTPEEEAGHRQEARNLLREAVDALETPEDRRTYRRQEYGSKLVEERADFLTAQATRHAMRQEWAEAIEVLESVIDMGIRTAVVLEGLDLARNRTS